MGDVLINIYPHSIILNDIRVERRNSNPLPSGITYRTTQFVYHQHVVFWAKLPFTLGLSNDLTRSYATAKFPTDSLNHSLGVYFGGTSVSVGGVVKASSAQLVDMPSGVGCVITNNGTTIATLTNENTYADLDGNPDESVAINLMGADITCHV